MLKRKFDYYSNEFETNKFILIIEEDITALLRSIPLLNLLGVDAYTYPYSWRRIAHFHQFSSVEHEFKHIQEMKESTSIDEKNKYCMITTHFHDTHQSEHSLSSLINVKSNSNFCFVLKKEDTSNKFMKGFVRPLDETEIFHKNLTIDYLDLYRDISNSLLQRYDSSIQCSMNLYLHLMSIIYKKILGISCRTPMELLKAFIDYPTNPFVARLVHSLEKYGVNFRNTALRDIVDNFKYHFELDSNEVNKLRSYYLTEFEKTDLDVAYWLEAIQKDNNMVNEILTFIEKFNQPIKGMMISHWKTLTNHLS